VPRDRLDTWKAIAAHVGRDVRTVLRWHKDRGLPVHRVPGGKGRSVFAYSDELDAWLESEARDTAAGSEPAQFPGFSRAVAVPAGIGLLALLLVAGGVLLARGMGPGDPVRIAIANKSITAFDAAHREVWRVPLPHHGALTTRGAVFADLDGDGSREILVPLTFAEPPSKPGGALYCLDARGRVRWTRSIDDTIRFGAGEFGPPWPSADVAVLRSGGTTTIAYAVNHGVWWPSIVARLDADGRVTGRFIHAGWITRLETASDGVTLFAGGVSNARDASILAVLDGDRSFGGAWPETMADYQCACPPARPVKYFVFPRSDANRVAGRLALRESIEVRGDGSLLVRVPQRSDLAADALYEFTPSLDLRRAAFADLYWDWHRQLEVSGVLDHSRDRCDAATPPLTIAASPSS
jgi:hypothetical protein